MQPQCSVGIVRALLGLYKGNGHLRALSPGVLLGAEVHTGPLALENKEHFKVCCSCFLSSLDGPAICQQDGGTSLTDGVLPSPSSTLLQLGPGMGRYF